MHTLTRYDIIKNIMKQKNTIIFTSLIAAIFFLTVCVYITSLVVEYNRGKIDSEECFTNLTHEIATACKTTIPGTPAFSQAMDQAVLNDASIAYIDLKTNDQLLFSYPSDLSSSNQTRSTFIRSYSTSISASDGSLLIFTAALYLLKPSSIFYKGRIAFLIILAATIAAFIYLILLSKSSDNANESIDKKTDDIIASVQDFDTPTNPESKESESTETETADNSFEPESIIPTASDIDTVSNTVTDIDTTHEPEQEQRKDDMTAAPSDPTFSEVNEEEVVESEEDEHSEDTKGLFSPITGFGWESYMTTRLDSELIRAASSEQDLALFTIRIPCLDRSCQAAKEIDKLILDTFKFKDLVFEYKEDGCTAIIQNVNIDQALVIADNLHIALTSILAKAGLDSIAAIGISTRSLRLISGSRLAAESEQALIHAFEDKESPVIAFRVNPEKYREYLSSEASQVPPEV